MKHEQVKLEVWRCPIYDCHRQYPATRAYLHDYHLATEHLEYFQARIDKATEKLVYGSRRGMREEVVREPKHPVSSRTTCLPESVPEHLLGSPYDPYSPLRAQLRDVAQIKVAPDRPTVYSDPLP